MKTEEKDNFNNAVLIKICREKFKTLDLRTCKILIEILRLLTVGKVKNLSEFVEILESSRPDAVASFLAELQGTTTEKQ
jgi:hypothetical protein